MDFNKYNVTPIFLTQMCPFPWLFEKNDLSPTMFFFPNTAHAQKLPSCNLDIATVRKRTVTVAKNVSNKHSPSTLLPPLPLKRICHNQCSTKTPPQSIV